LFAGLAGGKEVFKEGVLLAVAHSKASLNGCVGDGFGAVAFTCAGMTDKQPVLSVLNEPDS